MPPHRVTAVSPRQRHRNLATDTAGTHEYRGPGPALEVQNLQPLTDQRVERMSDDNETQIITGRRGTMPPPWESPTDAACATPVWGSSVPAPAAGETCGTATDPAARRRNHPPRCVPERRRRSCRRLRPSVRPCCPSPVPTPSTKSWDR